MLLYKQHRPKRKLFLPFGILSLAMLPLIGMLIISHELYQRTKPQHCLELFFSHAPKNASDTMFTPQAFEKLRSYTTYKLTDDTGLNNAIIRDAFQQLSKIKKTEDTLNGVHILFNDYTPYKDFIKCADMCLKEWPPVGSPFQEHFWMFYAPVDPIYKKKWDERHALKSSKQ